MSRAAKLVGALALFAVGLAAVAATVSLLRPAIAPERATGMPSDKIAELRTLAPGIDVLVIGGSRLLNGFDPAQFATETARLGQPLRAYNLSLQRLLLWEQERMLDDALALPGLKPRLIVLEPCVGLGIAPENFTHSRTIEFERPAAWWRAVENILGSDRSPAHQLWNVATHTVVLGLHLTHYGLLSERVFPAPRGLNPAPAGALGFEPKPDLPAGAPPDPWLADLIRQLPAEHAAARTEDLRLPPTMRRHFERLTARIRARGTQVIFLQPPQLAFTTAELRRLTHAFPRDFASVPAGPPVLSYLDPTRYPEFYDARLWADYNHLTASGARVFTGALARDLAEISRRPPAR